MLEHDLTTVDLVHREDATTYHARNPFPVGGVVEDPATGAAAAAFGAYLREHGHHAPARSPSTRASTWAARACSPSRSPARAPEIRVSGRAVAM